MKSKPKKPKANNRKPEVEKRMPDGRVIVSAAVNPLADDAYWPEDYVAPVWENPFLYYYSISGSQQFAASQSGVSVAAVYNRRKREPFFEERYDAAKAIAVAVLEAKAFALAQAGNERLLTFMLRKLAPEQYGDNIDITSGGKAITPVVFLPEVGSFPMPENE